MNKTIKLVFKSLLLTLIIGIIGVLVGYFVLVNSASNKVESIQSSIKKSVSDNNYLTKNAYDTILDIFEKIVKSYAKDDTKVIRVENGVINTDTSGTALDNLLVGIFINYSDDLDIGDELSTVKAQGDVHYIRVRLDFKKVQVLKWGTDISNVSAKKTDETYSIYFDTPASCLRYIK